MKTVMKTKKMNYWLTLVVLSAAALFLFSAGAEAKMKLSKKTVTTVQHELKMLGYYKGKVNGVFNKETSGAVKAFQKEHKLKVDGIPGKKTRNALYQAAKKQKGAEAQKKAAKPAKK